MHDEHFVIFCLVSEAWPTSSKDSRRLLAFFAKNFAPDSADLGFRTPTREYIHGLHGGVLKWGIPPTLLYHIISIFKVKTMRIYWDRRYQCSDQPIPAYIRDKPWAIVGEDMIQGRFVSLWFEKLDESSLRMQSSPVEHPDTRGLWPVTARSVKPWLLIVSTGSCQGSTGSLAADAMHQDTMFSQSRQSQISLDRHVPHGQNL